MSITRAVSRIFRTEEGTTGVKLSEEEGADGGMARGDASFMGAGAGREKPL
jgi:hypothetical protein